MSIRWAQPEAKLENKRVLVLGFKTMHGLIIADQKDRIRPWRYSSELVSVLSFLYFEIIRGRNVERYTNANIMKTIMPGSL